jgi:ribose-phosphate pyrophosphokinase
VPAFRIGPGRARDKIDVLPSAPLLAEAIRRLHEERPLTDLMVF